MARLGGFLARKGDGEPGVKALWPGLQRVFDFAAGVKFARQNQVLCVMGWRKGLGVRSPLAVHQELRMNRSQHATLIH